jgi:hypothetical protein
VKCHGARLNTELMSRKTVGDNSLCIRKPEAPCIPGRQRRVALGVSAVALGVAHSDSSIVTAKLAPHRTQGKIAGNISNRLLRRSKCRLQLESNPILPQLPLPITRRCGPTNLYSKYMWIPQEVVLRRSTRHAPEKGCFRLRPLRRSI